MSEIENSATKKTKSNPNGVSPNQSLPGAMRHMTNRAAIRQVERDRRAVAAVETVATWSRSPTAAAITPYAETLVMEQHRQHGKYYVHKASDKCWWVLRRVDDVGDDCLPSPSDVAVRWHRKYSYFYGREGYDDVTKAYNIALLSAVPGPKLKAEARARVWAVDDAIVEEMTTVVQSPRPVLVGHWAGTEAAKVKRKEGPTDGVYFKTYERHCRNGKERSQSV